MSSYTSRRSVARLRGLTFAKKAFYTTAEIAKILGVSTRTVLARIHDGSLYGFRLPRRIYRVPLGGLMQFLGEPPRVSRRVLRGKAAERWWDRMAREEIESE